MWRIIIAIAVVAIYIILPAIFGVWDTDREITYQEENNSK